MKVFPYLRAMNFRFNWDALGIATSVACAIHCAILPLLLTSLPVFGINIIENVLLEYGMIFLAFAIGMYSFGMATGSIIIAICRPLYFCAGIILLIAKQIWHNYQLWLLPFAVVFIVSAHIINYRACRVHDHAHADDCDH